MIHDVDVGSDIVMPRPSANVQEHCDDDANNSAMIAMLWQWCWQLHCDANASSDTYTGNEIMTLVKMLLQQCAANDGSTFIDHSDIFPWRPSCLPVKMGVS